MPGVAKWTNSALMSRNRLEKALRGKNENIMGLF